LYITSKVSLYRLFIAQEEGGEGNRIKNLDQHGIFTVNNKDFYLLAPKEKNLNICSN